MNCRRFQYNYSCLRCSRSKILVRATTYVHRGPLHPALTCSRNHTGCGNSQAKLLFPCLSKSSKTIFSDARGTLHDDGLIDVRTYPSFHEVVHAHETRYDLKDQARASQAGFEIWSMRGLSFHEVEHAPFAECINCMKNSSSSFEHVTFLPRNN